MPIDKFGRFNSSVSSFDSGFSFKKYIDDCLKKTKDDTEKQLSSLLVLNTKLQDQTNESIKHLQKSLKQVEEYKNKTNLSIFNLEKDYGLFDLYMKQSMKVMKPLEKKELETRMQMELQRTFIN